MRRKNEKRNDVEIGYLSTQIKLPTTVLIEHCAGKFPLWLNPEQATVLPISDRYNDYATEFHKYLLEIGIQATIDDRNEKIGKKIREAELSKIPIMLIVGEKEMESKGV